MGPVGRAAELGEIDALLEAAAAGSGGVVILVGPQGSGKTALIAAAAEMARDRGFEVLGAAPVRGQPGRLVWAQLLHDAGATEEDSRGLLDRGDLLAASAALRSLTAGRRRLIVIDDIDTGGHDAVEVLALVASRVVVSSTAVLATAGTPLGVGRDLKLAGLAEAELGQVIGDMPAEQQRAVWVASGGMPGIARMLAGQLDSLPPGRDALVHLALHAAQRGEFLAVDDSLIRLLEKALGRTGDNGIRARLLARMSRELLGEPLAGPRRRSLADEALTAARRAGRRFGLAEVLDARLYALWDPAGAEDRLTTAAELIRLGRAAGDEDRDTRRPVLAFRGPDGAGQGGRGGGDAGCLRAGCGAAGDAEGSVMALSRYAMLAVLRGRFDTGTVLAEEFTARARRIGLPDAERLTVALHGAVLAEQGTEHAWQARLDHFYLAARRFPGHFDQATAARILAALGQHAEAAAELDRLLPPVLAASGPRWLGAVTDLSAVAAEVSDRAAAAQLYEALRPYAGRLVVWGGANFVNGPASYFLGLLATELGKADLAVAHFGDAIDMAERIGARPALARILVAFGDALASRGGDGDERQAADLQRRAPTSPGGWT